MVTYHELSYRSLCTPPVVWPGYTASLWHVTQPYDYNCLVVSPLSSLNPIYSEYITCVTCHQIARANFMAPNVRWTLVQFRCVSSSQANVVFGSINCVLGSRGLPELDQNGRRWPCQLRAHNLNSVLSQTFLTHKSNFLCTHIVIEEALEPLVI